MKQLLTIALFLTVATAYSNNNSEKPAADFKRVQIGFNISPDVCYRRLTHNGTQLPELVVQGREVREVPKPSYSLGLNVVFNIKNFVGLEAGIHYADRGYQTKKADFNFATPESNSPHSGKFIYHYHYIDVPIKVNFTVGKKKVRFFVSTGIITGFALAESVTSVFNYDGRTERKTQPQKELNGKNRVNVFPVVSLGIDYKINNRMNLRVEPTFRYGLIPTYDTPIKEYWYSAGLNLSYYFGL